MPGATIAIRVLSLASSEFSQSIRIFWVEYVVDVISTRWLASEMTPWGEELEHGIPGRCILEKTSAYGLVLTCRL